jgi:SAM-dependent methyltransferase
MPWIEMWSNLRTILCRKADYMRKPDVTDYQAQIGLTRHLGGQAATDELIQLSGLEGGERLLEVGCGVGVTTALLAGRWVCHLDALDRSERMIARTRERLAAAGLSHRARSRRGEIEELPYAADLFDVVMGESATVCVEAKQEALREYLRVLRPGGILALNEPTWLHAGPPADVLNWVLASRDHSGALPVAAWGALLSNAGFESSRIVLRRTNKRSEQLGLIKRYHLYGILKALARCSGLWVRSPGYREYLHETRSMGRLPDGLYDYLGYGLYICRKPKLA